MNRLASTSHSGWVLVVLGGIGLALGGLGFLSPAPEPKPGALAAFVQPAAAAEQRETLYLEPLNVTPPPVASDPAVRYDYDIVYIRAPRKGDDVNSRWPEIAHPALMDAGADLMLLHPDGSEEVLAQGGPGAITDPVVSFDGEWVFYAKVHDLTGAGPWERKGSGADLYKIHLPTRKTVRLTHQEYTPNTGAAQWSRDYRTPEPGRTHLEYGVLNLGPCPLPGNRLAFVSNRNAFIPPQHQSPALQLFVMNDDGTNVEQIGYLNIGMALHPTVLTDGRIIFSSLESQALRNSILWGLWSIHPDGTNWGPVISAFDTGSAPNAFHFQTQLSDGSIVAEEYYNQNNSGFGAYFKLPAQVPAGTPPFGPAALHDPRNPPLRFGRHDNGRPRHYRLPFSPYGIEALTPFANNGEGLADTSLLGDKSSPRVGKFTHPAGAPDNHLLTVWSPGPVNHQNGLSRPAPDGGIYLIKAGQPIDEPGQMLLIKNDPQYNEQWPRAVVPYQRIYGIPEPKRLPPLANDGRQSPLLPAGTPFGLVGTSSLYKRESYPGGAVPAGSVTATFTGDPARDPYRGLDPFNTSENGASLNWFNQGADAGLYANSDIHAIRILAMEPTTDRHRGTYPRDGRLFYSHAMERLRILGEIPVRKFQNGTQPTDPDGQPDTSFLARIPADVAFTFQTLDKHGMVLNMAQTWHQLRPGEIRHDCGGCHAHSQAPTHFADTAAARPDYQVFDLTQHTPLLTDKARDTSGRQWDADDSTGLIYAPGIRNVEYFRDIQPLLQRSCAPCHTKAAATPPGQLVLDDDAVMQVPHQSLKVPGTYYRLALDRTAQFGYKPVIHNGEWRHVLASRYIRKFQSRRSLLTWKILGRRTDGWTNDDFPTETEPGNAETLHWRGQPVPNTVTKRNLADLDYNGLQMPPPEAVQGTWTAADGRKIQVPPLSAEEQRTFIRWIDLGCPIDLDYRPEQPDQRGYGWMVDDNRPTLALPLPLPGANPPLERLLIGLHDYDSGLDLNSFTVVADFTLDGLPPQTNLAPRFQQRGDGVWEWRLQQPLTRLKQGRLTVSIRDQQGNLTRIERTFSVAP